MKPENVKRLNAIKYSGLGAIVLSISALLSYQLTGDILFEDFDFSPLCIAILLAFTGIMLWVEINKVVKSEQDKIE